MTLRLLPDSFSVCRLSTVPQPPFPHSFCSLTVTQDEISWVGPSCCVPGDCLLREDGWRAFQVCGVLDFSLIGILARLTGLLSQHSIPVFAISTYNTDYLLIKEDFLSRAIEALRSGEISILI